MDMFDLAGTLFGTRRDQVAQGSTLTATGSTASADGVAGIVIDADVTPAEGIGDEDVDQTIIDLPTSPDVAEGDEVIVTLVGDGPLKTPIVTANPGSGDRMAAAVQDAHDLAASVEGIAQEAKEVAEATGQHFWPDTDGVHVTEVTQDEWNDSTGTSYHSGANVLLNALGQLFRDGLNNLLALIAGTAKVESFEITSSYILTCNLTSEPLGGASGLTVTSSSGDLTSSDWMYSDNNQSVTIYASYTSGHVGDTITVSYRTSSGMALYDGAGNGDGNIVASFTGNGITIGKTGGAHVVFEPDVVRFYDGTDQTASFSSTGAIIGPLTISTHASGGGSPLAYIYADQIALGSLFNSRSGELIGGLLSDHDGPGMVGSDIGLTPVTLVSGTPQTGTKVMVPMEQAICSLRRPFAMFRGANNSTTATATGWRLTSFDTVMAHGGDYDEYFTFSGGVLTALQNIRVEISGCMSWTDSVAGIRGFGVRHNSSTASGGTEYSEFQHFPSDVTSRKSVWMAGLVLNVGAGVKCAICRYEQSGAVYVNGTNFSRVEIKVLGVY